MTAGGAEKAEARRSRLWRRYRVVIAVVSATLLVVLQRVLSAWIDRTWAFVSGLALLVALFLLLDWVLDLILPGLWRVLGSLGRSIGRDIAEDPELGRALGHTPRLDRWLRGRFSTEGWTGWYLTATTVVSGVFLWGFLEIAAGLLTGTALTRLDPGVAAFVAAYRTPALTRVMWAFTLLGDTIVVFALMVVTIVLLLVWGRRRYALLVGLVVSTGVAAETLVKVLVQRPRPPAGLMLVKTPMTYAFPSGHATASVLLYGVVVFVVFLEVPGVRERLLALLAAASVLFMIGLSRVYLGVHWMTDVHAGWALGAAWLALAIGVFLAWVRYGHALDDARPLGDARARWLVTVGVTLVAVGTIVIAAERDPVLAQAVAPPPTEAVATVPGVGGLPTLPPASVADLPRFSEALDGSHTAPVGMIFIGDQAQLVSAFRDAGWQVADQSTFVTVLHAFVSAAVDQPYPTAPVTPSFVDGKTQDLAFEQAAGRATVRRRHHTRFWMTDETAGGRPIWVATASLDKGIGVVRGTLVPTHVIDPNIDAERDYIARQLRATGLVDISGVVRVSPPVQGTNAQGDPFYTQGAADVLVAR